MDAGAGLSSAVHFCSGISFVRPEQILDKYYCRLATMSIFTVCEFKSTSKRHKHLFCGLTWLDSRYTMYEWMSVKRVQIVTTVWSLNEQIILSICPPQSPYLHNHAILPPSARTAEARFGWISATVQQFSVRKIVEIPAADWGWAGTWPRCEF